MKHLRTAWSLQRPDAPQGDTNILKQIVFLQKKQKSSKQS